MKATTAFKCAKQKNKEMQLRLRAAAWIKILPLLLLLSSLGSLPSFARAFLFFPLSSSSFSLSSSSSSSSSSLCNSQTTLLFNPSNSFYLSSIVLTSLTVTTTTTITTTTCCFMLFDTFFSFLPSTTKKRLHSSLPKSIRSNLRKRNWCYLFEEKKCRAALYVCVCVCVLDTFSISCE